MPDGIRNIGVELSCESDDFKKQMRDVNSNLSNMKTEMKAVTAEFAENANGAEALAKKQKILDNEAAQQKVRMEALARAYAEMVKNYGENSVQADKYRKQLNNARADYAKATQAAEDNNKALKEARTITERVANAKKRLGDKLDDLRKPFKDVETVANAAGKALGNTAKAAGTLVGAGAAATGALAALAVSGLKTVVGWATDAATQLDENGEVMDKRFSTLAANLTGLQTGADGAKAAISTALLPALEGLTGEGSKLLEGFVADLNAAEGDAEKMGEVVSTYIRKAAAMIRRQAPVFLNSAGELLESLFEGVTDNLDVILDLAGDILEMLVRGLTEHADELADGAVAIVTGLLDFLIEAAPDLLTAGITFVAQLISGLAAAQPSLIEQVPTLIKTLLTALGENAPQMTIAGLELILALVEGLVEAIPELIKAIPEILAAFKQAWEEHGDEIRDLGKRIVDKIRQGLLEAWEGVKTWFADAISSLSGGHITVNGAPHASGINFVPYDNYPAILHRGERVLTAAENAAGAGSRPGRSVSITINARELTHAQADYIIRLANELLGGDV